jgi:hypothetical protein
MAQCPETFETAKHRDDLDAIGSPSIHNPKPTGGDLAKPDRLAFRNNPTDLETDAAARPLATNRRTVRSA